MNRDRPYRGLTAAQLQVEYQPALHVASLQSIIDDWNGRIGRARSLLPHQRVPYGEHPDEWLWHIPGDKDRPVVVFIHGGYWRRQSADDGFLLALSAHRLGLTVVSVNYSLCPSTNLGAIIDQCRRAVGFLKTAGCSPLAGSNALHLAGHSAGAHLAACVSQTQPGLAGLILISGIFDVLPLLHTPINEDIRMTPAQAQSWSPAAAVPTRPETSCLVAWGGDETAEFSRQGQQWAHAWTAIAGNRPALAMAVPGRHHFDVIDDFLEPGTRLGDAVIAHVTGSPATHSEGDDLNPAD